MTPKHYNYSYLENGIDFIAQFTYYSETISPALWSLCGPLLQAVNGWAYDFIPEITTPLLNFMTKDGQTFHLGSMQVSRYFFFSRLYLYTITSYVQYMTG